MLDTDSASVQGMVVLKASRGCPEDEEWRPSALEADLLPDLLLLATLAWIRRPKLPTLSPTEPALDTHVDLEFWVPPIYRPSSLSSSLVPLPSEFSSRYMSSSSMGRLTYQ